jgi:drug/metabolite transporter (DMT)-like permease
MGIVLALVSSFLWGIADFAGGTVSRRLPVLVVVPVSQASGLVAVLCVASVAGSWSDPAGYLPWAVAAGIIGAAGLLAFYHALAIGTMGVVAPIAALGVVVPVAAGVASGQWPSHMVGIGIVLAVAGVVGAGGPERSAGHSMQPVVLAVISAMCFGAALLFITKGSAYSPVMTMVSMRMASVAVFGGLMIGLRRRIFRRPASPSGGSRAGVFLIVVVAGLFDVSANLAFAFASTVGSLAIVAVLGSLYPAVTVVLARVVHGERLRHVQQAGVAVALVGVALIAGWS